jgi:4-amino-4-deoxy-L-arabinose transferase-like glycosyltransferase
MGDARSGDASGSEDGDGTTVNATVRTSPRRNRILHFWRSPPDQPRWARPALLLVAGLAALSYAWGITHVTVETYYAAAARSMAQSWHNFFFASFDPWGTVSIDKLPGAFWLQALSLRAFGFHLWAIALPQVLEGTLTVLVLYRVVRRVAGPAAGLTAAIVLAASPVTVLLHRGNVSDSLLILLLVLAADAATVAFTTGRLGSLVLAGALVGLAFQAKMLQAWLVLPALYGTYILAAPVVSLYRRCGHVLLSALAVLVVSLSWVSLVAVVPAHSRPYADGSCDNSVFSQVVLYTGADRLTGKVLNQSGCTPAPARPVESGFHGSTTTTGTVAVTRGPGRFLNGPFGRDAAWVLVPAVVALVALLIVRRRQPRTDALRAATVMWTATLFFTWTFFSSSDFLNSYYLAALIPPLAALSGMGLALAWRLRQASRAVPLVAMATVATGAAYALALVPDDAGVRPWVITTTALAALTAIGLLAFSLLRPQSTFRIRTAGLGCSVVALLLGPAWASATVVVAGLGPFDSPYQSAALTALIHTENQKALATWPALIREAAHYPSSVSVDTQETSSAVSLAILGTGREFLPVGGFTGRVPNPTLPQFIGDVARHRVERVLVAVRPLTRNPDLRWVVEHCAPEATRNGTLLIGGVSYRHFHCDPADATPP